MFGVLKRLFQKQPRQPKEAPAQQPPPIPQTKPGPETAAQPRPRLATPTGFRTRLDTIPKLRGRTPAAPSTETLRLPSTLLCDRLPPTLAARLRQAGPREIPIPLHRILSQLPTGAVRITIAELRQALEPGVLPEDPAQDAIEIELPLPELLTRLHPGQLKRRAQRKVQTPDFEAPIFGPQAQSAPPSVQPPPESAAPAAPTPPAPEEPSITLTVTAACVAWPDLILTEIDKYGLRGAILVAPVARLELAMQTGRANFAWAEISRWFRPGFPAGFTPDPVAWLDLPMNVVTPLFMQRMPQRPRKKSALAQPIADLFTGSGAAPSEAPTATHSMPASLAALLPQPTAAFSPIHPDPEPRLDTVVQIMSSLTQPDWSPMDSVKKMAEFPGVSGIMLATKDGLVVADKLPSELNADRLAAFLPQMFARMGDYALELRMGPMSALAIHLEAGPCEVIDGGILYLIVVGKPGEPLPAAQLHKIAAEMAKRTY